MLFKLFFIMIQAYYKNIISIFSKYIKSFFIILSYLILFYNLRMIYKMEYVIRKLVTLNNFESNLLYFFYPEFSCFLRSCLYKYIITYLIFFFLHSIIFFKLLLFLFSFFFSLFLINSKYSDYLNF